MAFLPVGYAIAGPLAGVLTITRTLWLAVAWLVVSTAIVLAVPSVTGLRAPSPADRPPAGPSGRPPAGPPAA